MVLETAVVGAGVVSDIHLSALDQCPRTRLTAVCDVDEQRATKAARKYGVDAVFDLDELLADDDLDWLHICTPVQTHLDIARASIEAGVPVNIEKPVTETVAEAEELQRLSDDHGVPVSVLHQHLFDPAIREVRERIASGELGTLRGADLIYSGETPPDQVNRDEWAFDLVGGEFEEGLPHPLYIMLGTAGYPRSREEIQVTTDLHGEYDRPFTYDTAQVTYPNATGAPCSIQVMSGAPKQRLLTLHGERQSLTVDLVSQTVIDVDDSLSGSSLAKVKNNLSRAADRLIGTAKNGYLVAEERVRDDDWERTKNLDSHYYQIDAEAQALERGDDPVVPLLEGTWTITLMEAIREASQQERTMAIADGG